MDMNELLGLLQIYPPTPPARPGRTQALQGEVWPGYDMPERGRVWEGTGNLQDPVWQEGDKDFGYFQLPMPRERMTPEVSREVPHVPTVQQMQPSFDPQLRIGSNEPAQRARASREGRAADLFKLRAAYEQGGPWF